MRENKKILPLIVGLLIIVNITYISQTSAKETRSYKGSKGYENYTVVMTDELHDVKNFTSPGAVAKNESIERPNIDLSKVYLKHNETSLFIKLEVLGEIEISFNVDYVIGFISTEMHPTYFWWRQIRFWNGSATLIGEENRTITAIKSNSSLLFEIPILYLQAEHCVEGNAVRITSMRANEAGFKEHNGEWICEYFYTDNITLDFTKQFYFFALGATIISITPNPAIKGEPVKFIGAGGDPYENITCTWISDKDGCLSTSFSFTTRNLSPGNHTIVFRAINSTATVEEKMNISVEDITPKIFNDPQSDVKNKTTQELVENPNIDIKEYSVVWGHSTIVVEITVYGKIEDANGTHYYVDFGKVTTGGTVFTIIDDTIQPVFSTSPQVTYSLIAWYEAGQKFFEVNGIKEEINVYHNNSTIVFEIPIFLKWDHWHLGKDGMRGVGAYNPNGHDECAYYIPSQELNISVTISITPNPAVEGEIIYFSAHSNVSDDFLYEWRSDIDGVLSPLSNKSSFTTNNLSVGNHTITLRIIRGKAEGPFILVHMGEQKIVSTTLIIEPKIEKTDAHIKRVNLVMTLLATICVIVALLWIGGREKNMRKPWTIYHFP